MGYPGFIARRHLTRRRKTGFISIISFISVAGVCVGVMALIVVLAVMSGFDRELKKKIINVQPHLRIEKIGGISDVERDITTILNSGVEGLRSVSPFIEGQAILRSNKNATGVVVKGIDPARENLSIYGDDLMAGELDFSTRRLKEETRKWLFFKGERERDYGSIVIGRGLAFKLGVDVGDVIHFISPNSATEESILKIQTIKSHPFVISGIFHIGMNEFDNSLALIGLKEAQKVYGLGNKVTGLSLRFDDVDTAQEWKWNLSYQFTSDYILRSWYDLNHNFFQALKVEKSVMTILLALIVLVAAFNIISTLTMVVMEKTRDIGVLRAIGASRMGIRIIFIVEGFWIGFVGVFTGTAFGLWMASNLNTVSDFIKKTTGLEVFPSDIYYFDKIPSEIHGMDVVWTVVFALAACIFAGFYPAHRAAMLNPVEALRSE